MLKEFKNLNPAEVQDMYDAIALITILIAGADDEMDEVELAEAQRLADIRSFNNLGHIIAYYEHVQQNLAERINQLSQELSANVTARQAELRERLGRLNGILAKLPLPFGYLYYKDFLSFAHHVAEAHGGFLRYMTIGPKEAKVVDLPMIDPVPRPSKIDFPDLP